MPEFSGVRWHRRECRIWPVHTNATRQTSRRTTPDTVEKPRFELVSSQRTFLPLLGESTCLAWSPRARRSADFSPQGCWLAKEALEFCGRVCALLTFLRDKSRAPAAIVVGTLNTYNVSTLGGQFRIARVPKGRLNERHVLRELMGMNFSRPFGTWSIRALLPTLKRWAIVVRSLQDGNPDVYPMEYNHAPVKPCPTGLATKWLLFCHAPQACFARGI